jgi:hypothetical protein
MREFIGHVLKVVATGFPGPVEGVMVDDRPNLIMLMGKDKKVTRIVKSHICGFAPMDEEPKEYVPFTVLACQDEKAKCPGVQYVVEGAGFKKSDFEVFMGACPCRSEDCRFGSKGELRSVDGPFLRGMLAGAMFGAYPERKEKRHGSGISKAGGKAGAAGGRAVAPEAGPDGSSEV